MPRSRRAAIRAQLAALIALAALTLASTACKGRSQRRAEPAADQTAEQTAEQTTEQTAEAAHGQQAVSRVFEDRTRPAPTAERVVVERVAMEVVDPDGPDAPKEIYPTLLSKQFGQALAQSGQFAADPAAVPDGLTARAAEARLRVSYDVIARGDAGWSIVAAVEAQIAWRDGDDLPTSDHIIAERPVTRNERGNLDGLVATHVADTVARAADGVIRKEALRTASHQAVIDALVGAADVPADVLTDDVDRMLWALELVADRQLGAAFDATVAALSSEHVQLRDRALTALVAIGDPRAVDLLAKRADLDDYDFVRMVIEAAAALGGEDARIYLEFVASGHPDSDIQSRAAEALERLDRRHREPRAP